MITIKEGNNILNIHAYTSNADVPLFELQKLLRFQIPLQISSSLEDGEVSAFDLGGERIHPPEKYISGFSNAANIEHVSIVVLFSHSPEARSVKVAYVWKKFFTNVPILRTGVWSPFYILFFILLNSLSNTVGGLDTIFGDDKVLPSITNSKETRLQNRITLSSLTP